MRIAIVTETYPPEINGVALTVQSLAQGLHGRGHQVQLIRPRQPAADADAALVDDDVQVTGAALPRYPGLRFGLPARRRLESLWKAQRPDAIYVATEGPLGHSALRAANRLGIAASTGFHTRFDDFARHYGVGFLTPLVFAWLRHFHGRSAATLVPTQELADFLGKNGFNHVRLLRRAVDTQLFDPARRDAALRARWGLTDDELAVVYVGRIAPEKNLALNVRAFRALQQHCPAARYIWIGDGPARAELARQNPDFIFAGTLRGEELARHFASCDLFLFASLSETFGNVTLEAMASGVATLAFDYGAAREHIVDGGNGRRIACSNGEAFVEAAVQFARDPALRHRLAAAGRDAMRGLSPQSVTDHFAELLANLRSRA
ncbi:glycosyltransferase involved in cell wall biosynthesis [Tahibacter aquaticus]|uniref:Glycosyltransferase involved in cell wall biosynthesis n=1 Tax=Tahibacter aquaticus TaxID=520092 RepID=A0A4R6YWX0_9GAMM|nr:glycosyltransferase family 1 protein [Tahibacter aquaticus]TDR43142.1 glycosyltransferase involved in cell wall biosynthesis [Tahibacter aquaticus]